MTKEEIEIIRCALVQLLIKNQNEKKEIESIIAKIDSYEKEVDSFKTYFLEAYELGLKDKTVKRVKSVDIFYYSTTHSLLELCKKMSANHALLEQDKSNEKAAEVECLVKLILDSLKNL